MTLPRDLLIFLPLASTTKPCVRTALYGAVPLVPMLDKREDWNQPSRMSSSFKNSPLPHFGHLTPSGRNSLRSFENQTSAPCFSNIFTRLSMRPLSRKLSLQLAHEIAGIGTPHARCLERHQSGLPSTML